MKLLNLSAVIGYRELPFVAHIPDMTYGHGGVKELDELNYELFKTYMRSPARYVVNTGFIRQLSEGLMTSLEPWSVPTYGRVGSYVNKVSGGDSVPFELDDNVPDGVLVAVLTL